MIEIAVLQQKALYMSLLLGFAVSLAVALIAMRDTRRITSTAIVAFLLAAFLLFIDTFTSMRLVIELQKLPDPAPQETLMRLRFAAGTVANCDTLGLLALMIGIGLSGWVHSRLLGVLTSLGAVLTVAVLVRFALIAMGG